MGSSLRRTLTTAALLIALLLGAAVEYKLHWLDALQSLRHRPPPLPEYSINIRHDAASPAQENVVGAPASPIFWPQWRERLRDRLLADLGHPLQPPQTVAVTLGETVKLDGVIRQDLLFTARDGQPIPARVLYPQQSTDSGSAAVLVIPGHVPAGQSGLRQVTEPMVSYQHSAGLRLAQQGFVVLAFELRGFGYLGEPDFPEHRLQAVNALREGGSYKSTVLSDAAFAMSVLRHWPGVDPNRVAITGASLGGELAVQYAALDSAVAAVSFHSYGGGLGVPVPLSVHSELPHLCHLLPGIDDYMTQEAWFWLLAPRPVQGIRGSENNNRFVQRQGVYGQGWADPESITLRVETGGHEYFTEPAIAFLQSVLQQDSQ